MNPRPPSMWEQPLPQPLPPQENTEAAESVEVDELPPPREQRSETPRSYSFVGEPLFVLPETMEPDHRHRHHRGRKHPSPLLPEPVEQPEPRQKGRTSFKLRSPRKETSSAKKLVATEAPDLAVAPPPSHQQHHENTPQTPRQWTPLNHEAEPWQPWSPSDNPAATQGPSLYADTLLQPKPCLRPHRHHRHFRRLRPTDPRSPRKVHFPEEAIAHYRPFSPTDPSDYVQDWYNHFNPYRLFQTLPPQ